MSEIEADDYLPFKDESLANVLIKVKKKHDFLWSYYYLNDEISVAHFFIIQGVMAAAPLAYVFPAACVMRLRQEAIFSRRNIAAILLMAFGIVIAVVGFVMAIINVAEGATCSHGMEPSYCPKSDNDTHLTSTISATTVEFTSVKTNL